MLVLIGVAVDVNILYKNDHSVELVWKKKGMLAIKKRGSPILSLLNYISREMSMYILPIILPVLPNYRDLPRLLYLWFPSSVPRIAFRVAPSFKYLFYC